MSQLYPPIDPYLIHHLDTGDGHCLYVEESGHPDGIPVLFLHGGPGSGTKPYHRSFYHPERYRILLLDQRGAGLSEPSGCLEANDTAHLLSDMEMLRQRLGIGSWLLSGGSWGATLALLYAQRHPEYVRGLILRGSFLARQRDIDWFMGPDGVRRIYPEDWCTMLEGVDDPALEGERLLEALYQRLMGSDELASRRALRAWLTWGGRVTLGPQFDAAQAQASEAAALAQIRIELHYAMHRYFIEENQILDHCHRLQGIPVTLIHGRQDMVCPMESAWLLHQALPGSRLVDVPEGGHVASHPAMMAALVDAADDMLSEDRVVQP
ncbi:MAG: prolyl aminopeptidase [Pseudomonadota bacterium]|jgi:proline iminopeptidase